MKKVDESKYIVIPSVSLYREDIDSILEIFRKVAKDVSISDGEFEYTSIEELKGERGDSVKKLKLTGFNPCFLSLTFDRMDIINGTTLYVNSNEEAALAAFYQIKEILSRRRKIMNYIFHPVIGLMCALFLVVLATFVRIENLKEILPPRVVRISLFLALLSIAVLSLLYRIGFFFSINLKKGHESPSFLSRQKDDIIKLIIGALLGGLITWLFTKN